MIKIYHAKGTRSIRVIWLCEELGLPYQVEVVPFTTEFSSSPEWRRLNPVGKLPVMIDGDLTQYESGAMVQTIIDRYANGALQPKRGTTEHAMYLQWSWFAEATFARPLGEIVNHRRVFSEAEQSLAAIEEMQTRARLCLKAVDEAVTESKFILGGEFSGADIMMGYSLMLCDIFAPAENFQNASRYRQELRNRPACVTAFSY